MRERGGADGDHKQRERIRAKQKEKEERRDKGIFISWPCVWMRHYLNRGMLYMSIRERSDH